MRMLDIILRPELTPFPGLLLAYLLAYFVIKYIIIDFLKLKTTTPVSIIVWCIFYSAAILFHFALVAFPLETLPRILYLPMILDIFSLIWIYGIWKMKKWGIIGFTATFIVSQLYSISQGIWIPLFSLMTIAYILVIPYYSFSKMK